MFRGDVSFVEVRGANLALGQRFSVKSYPTVLAVCGGSEKATVSYEGAISGALFDPYSISIQSLKFYLNPI